MFSNLFMFADRTDVSFISARETAASLFPLYQNNFVVVILLVLYYLWVKKEETCWEVGKYLKALSNIFVCFWNEKWNVNVWRPFAKWTVSKRWGFSALTISYRHTSGAWFNFNQFIGRMETRILDFMQAKRFIMQCICTSATILDRKNIYFYHHLYVDMIQGRF